MHLTAFLYFGEWVMLDFENPDKFMLPGVGKYGIPQIAPVSVYPQGKFTPANYR